jgi:poly(hydroxyalkanoate) depolymerase family esterase
MRKSLAAIAATTAAAVAAALSTVVTLAPSASAASLTQITNFGYNPTGLSMYEYVPANVSARPPLLVVLHYCSGSAQSMFSGTEFPSLADRYGFMEIYPQVNDPSNDCWDVSSDGALTHNGNSDPAGIMSMIQYAEAHNNVDPSRVYVTGASSGGMMTEVMLGDYPEVFQAGSDFEGVPFHCFYTGTVRGWNSACAQGQVSNTPQVWGDYVRAAYPGYSGPRPRVQLWHGTADTTLSYNNFGELIKQWTNVFGVSQTPSSTAVINGNWTHTTYGSATNPVVDAYSIAGVGHTLPLSGMAAVAIHFFGLDGSASTGSPSPSTSSTPSASASASASPSASATGTGAAAACKVSNAVSAWNTGLTDNVTITNTGSTAINGWQLTFTLASGQTITNAWNATITPASGAVTASNLSYDASIPPGGTTSFGFQANQTGNAAPPSGFALNGAACTSS